MKKYIALFLIAAALMTSCSSGDSETESVTETEASAETAETENESETAEETKAPAPENMEYFQYYTLETAKEPVYENGMLIVYFTEDDIRFTDESVFYIGIRNDDVAYSVNADPQNELYPDMITDKEKNFYSGVALLPEEEIPAGEYLMSVTFEEFICEFDIVIQ